MPQVIPYVVKAFAAVGAGTATFWQAATVFAVKTAATMALSYGIQKMSGNSYDTKAALRGRTMNYRQSAQPRMSVYGRTRVGGQVVFMGTSGSDEEYLHIVIVHCDHEVNSLGAIYLDGEEVPFSGANATGKYAGYLSAWGYTGTDSQAADSTLVAAFTGWTSDHRLRGCAYTHFRLKYDAEGKVFPGGVPSLSRIVEGRKVYDPRTETTAYSANWALCLADYIKRAYRATNDDFDESAWIAAANVSDEDITRVGLTTEKRYTINGTVLADEEPGEVVRRMRDAGAGFAEEIGGLWVIHAGAWRAPTVTLDEDDFISGVTVDTKASIYEGGNRVKGVFANSVNGWVPGEYPAVTNATYLSEDNNKERWLTINHDFVTSAATCQRVGKIALERARQQVSISGLSTVSALKVRAGDVVNVNFAKFGFSAKTFEVEALRLAVIGDDDNPALGVELRLRETAAGIYDWADGEETEIDLAPNTTLKDPWTVAAPTWGTLASGTDHLVSKSDGTVISRLYAPWTPGADAFVDSWQLQFATSAQAALANWQQLPDMPAGARSVLIPDVTDGTAYKVRIRAVNSIGIKSSWVESSAHTIVGKSASPTTPSNFAAVALTEAVSLSWDHIADADRDEYRIFKSTTSTKPASPSYVTASNQFTAPNLAADILHYFWLESVDTTGNVSSTHAGPVTATPDAKSVAVGEGALTANVTGYVFQARADGVLTESFDNGDSTIEVFLGSAAKTYDAGGANDTWRFGTITATNVTRDATVTAPAVGISAMSADSGYLSVEIIYTRTDAVERTITAKVLYGKNKGSANMWASGFSISLPASAAGVVSSFAAASWTPTVYWAGAVKTYAATPTNDRWRFGTITATNCTQNGSLTAPEIGISALSADSGRLQVGIIYRDDQGVDYDATTYGTFSKAYTGSTGPQGPQGTNGTRIANGLVYLTTPQASTPTTPSATAFNFTTGAFTGLTAGWQVTPVEVVLSDTTTKYWVSRYNISEATLDGVQTLTFATPVGSINFGSDIQSDNFITGASGWQIQRDTGNAEFNDVTIRGNLVAGSTMDALYDGGEILKLDSTGIHIENDGSRFQYSASTDSLIVQRKVLSSLQAYTEIGHQKISFYDFSQVLAAEIHESSLRWYNNSGYKTHQQEITLTGAFEFKMYDGTATPSVLETYGFWPATSTFGWPTLRLPGSAQIFWTGATGISLRQIGSGLTLDSSLTVDGTLTAGGRNLTAVAVSVKDHGTDAELASDPYAALAAAATAAGVGGTVRVPSGDYGVPSSPVSILAGQTWIMEGPSFDLSGTTAVLFLANAVNDWAIIGHWTCTGDNSAAGATSGTSYALKIVDCERFTVGAGFKALSIKGWGILAQAGSSTSGRAEHGAIVAPHFHGCYVGMEVQAGNGAEYISVSTPTITRCNTGMVVAAGNLAVSGGSITDNTDNVRLSSGANHAHGIFSGVNINHATQYNVVSDGVTNGHTFSGCHLYEGDIWLKDSNGILFKGCIVDAASYYFDGSDGCGFIDCTMPGGYANTINNNFDSSPSYTIWQNCKTLSGELFEDALKLGGVKGVRVNATSAGITVTVANLASEQTLLLTDTANYSANQSAQTLYDGYSAATGQFTCHGKGDGKVGVSAQFTISHNAADDMSDVFMYIRKNGAGALRWLNRVYLTTTSSAFLFDGDVEMSDGETIEFRIGGTTANNVTVASSGTSVVVDGL